MIGRCSPVISLHFWVINTHAVKKGDKEEPVISLHFWVINTYSEMERRSARPVISLHFWVINTKGFAVIIDLDPVISLHFWVINTPGSRCSSAFPPVISLHFWVINTQWWVITWEWIKSQDLHTRRLALYSRSASGTDCYFCILPFCKIVCRTSRPLALA